MNRAGRRSARGGWLLIAALLIARDLGPGTRDVAADPRRRGPAPQRATAEPIAGETGTEPPGAARLAARLSGARLLADRAAFHRGRDAVAQGRLDEACAAFAEAARSPLPSLALRAEVEHARCRLA